MKKVNKIQSIIIEYQNVNFIRELYKIIRRAGGVDQERKTRLTSFKFKTKKRINVKFLHLKCRL